MRADKDVIAARCFIIDYMSFTIHQGYQSMFDSSSGMNYVMDSDVDNNVTIMSMFLVFPSLVYSQ